jgi:hypothetical protein
LLAGFEIGATRSERGEQAHRLLGHGPSPFTLSRVRSFRLSSAESPRITSTFLSEFRRQAPAARAAGASDKGRLANQIQAAQHLLWDYFLQLYCHPSRGSAIPARRGSTLYCSRAAWHHATGGFEPDSEKARGNSTFTLEPAGGTIHLLSAHASLLSRAASVLSERKYGDSTFTVVGFPCFTATPTLCRREWSNAPKIGRTATSRRDPGDQASRRPPTGRLTIPRTGYAGQRNAPAIAREQNPRRNCGAAKRRKRSAAGGLAGSLSVLAVPMKKFVDQDCRITSSGLFHRRYANFSSLFI